MNKENLLVLATHLDQFDDDYPDFEMADFIEGGDPTKWADYALHNGGVGSVCGSAACAVGHGPSAGFLFNENEFTVRGVWRGDQWVENVKDPNWIAYCQRVFGVGGRSFDARFDFMFGGHWTNYDNTPRGAAARIRWCIEHGPMPDPDCDDDWESFRHEQIKTYSCYRKES